MKRVKISVTQDDILSGFARSSRNCPVARAILRQTPLTSVAVYGDVFDLYRNGLNPVYEMDVPAPRSVERFVKRFDKGLPLKPFNFFLPVTW